MTASDDDRRFKNRRARAATWASENPVLLAGEIGVVKDADEFRIGDGVTAWNDLPPYGPAQFLPYTTAGRPLPAAATTYFDTTLNIPAWSDGTDWRDATGTVI